MRLIRCDRCPATFPADTPHTVLRQLNGVRTDPPDLGLRVLQFELCDNCRTELAVFLARPELRDADTCGMGDEQPCVHGTPAGRFCLRCDHAENPPEEPEPEADRPPASSPAAAQTSKRCCDCGREGKRRFVPAEDTETGWRCWRCEDTRKRQLPVAEPAEPEGPADVSPDPEPPAEPARPAPLHAGVPPAPDVTARCQDCTRVFRLTGIPLQAAVEQHELRHSHVVAILEGAEDAS